MRMHPSTEFERNTPPPTQMFHPSYHGDVLPQQDLAVVELVLVQDALHRVARVVAQLLRFFAWGKEGVCPCQTIGWMA